MKTADVARQVGVHPNTVRLYEEWGYLPPIPRDAAGRRMFTAAHLEQLRFARLTLHRAPHAGPQLREAYRDLVWLRCAGDTERAVTLANKFLTSVQAAGERAADARLFLLGSVPVRIAHAAGRPLHIQQAATFVGESVPVIRRWEANALIHVPRHPTNRYRIYGANELGWLVVVHTLRLAGYRLVLCRQLIHRYHAEERRDSPRLRSAGSLGDAIAACGALFGAHAAHLQTVLEQLHQLDAGETSGT